MSTFLDYKAYFLASGITTIDLHTGTHLIGQHEVFLIPESDIILNREIQAHCFLIGQHEAPLIPEKDMILISGTQAHCFGIYIDSKSCCFGGRGSILFKDDVSITLRPECLLHMNWILYKFTCLLLPPLGILPTTVSESLDDTLPVTLGYSHDLGELDLLDHNLDLSNSREVTTAALDKAVELKQVFCWIQMQKTSQIHYTHTRIKDADYERYLPFFGWKTLEVNKCTFKTANQ